MTNEEQAIQGATEDMDAAAEAAHDAAWEAHEAAKGPMIHGHQGMSLAAIMEYMQMPNHPFHAGAIEQAQKFIEAEKKAENERSRTLHREQAKHMPWDEAAWSRIVD